MMWRLVLLVPLAIGAACTPSAVGRFACTSDADCSEGFRCSVGVCAAAATLDLGADPPGIFDPDDEEGEGAGEGEPPPGEGEVVGEGEAAGEGEPAAGEGEPDPGGATIPVTVNLNDCRAPRTRACDPTAPNLLACYALGAPQRTQPVEGSAISLTYADGRGSSLFVPRGKLNTEGGETFLSLRTDEVSNITQGGILTNLPRQAQLEGMGFLGFIRVDELPNDDDDQAVVFEAPGLLRVAVTGDGRLRCTSRTAALSHVVVTQDNQVKEGELTFVACGVQDERTMIGVGDNRGQYAEQTLVGNPNDVDSGGLSVGGAGVERLDGELLWMAVMPCAPRLCEAFELATGRREPALCPSGPPPP